MSSRKPSLFSIHKNSRPCALCKPHMWFFDKVRRDARLTRPPTSSSCTPPNVSSGKAQSSSQVFFSQNEDLFATHTHNCQYCFFTAAFEGNIPRLVGCLVDSGAIEAYDPRESTVSPLLTPAAAASAAADPSTLSRLKFIVADEGKLYSKNKADKGREWTILHYAAHGGHISMVDLLITALGMLVETTAEKGWTPLYVAVRNGQLAMVKRLVEVHRANVQVRNTNRANLVHAAAAGGFVDTIPYLVVAHGLDPNEPDTMQFTPILCAANNGHLAVVAFLFDWLGISPADSKGTGGATVLHYAAGYAHAHLVYYLMTRPFPKASDASVWRCARRAFVTDAARAKRGLIVSTEDNETRTDDAGVGVASPSPPSLFLSGSKGKKASSASFSSYTTTNKKEKKTKNAAKAEASPSVPQHIDPFCYLYEQLCHNSSFISIGKRKELKKGARQKNTITNTNGKKKKNDGGEEEKEEDEDEEAVSARPGVDTVKRRPFMLDFFVRQRSHLVVAPHNMSGNSNDDDDDADGNSTCNPRLAPFSEAPFHLSVAPRYTTYYRSGGRAFGPSCSFYAFESLQARQWVTPPFPFAKKSFCNVESSTSLSTSSSILKEDQQRRSLPYLSTFFNIKEIGAKEDRTEDKNGDLTSDTTTNEDTNKIADRNHCEDPRKVFKRLEARERRIRQEYPLQYKILATPTPTTTTTTSISHDENNKTNNNDGDNADDRERAGDAKVVFFHQYPHCTCKSGEYPCDDGKHIRSDDPFFLGGTGCNHQYVCDCEASVHYTRSVFNHGKLNDDSCNDSADPSSTATATATAAHNFQRGDGAAEYPKQQQKQNRCHYYWSSYAARPDRALRPDEARHGCVFLSATKDVSDEGVPPAAWAVSTNEFAPDSVRERRNNFMTCVLIFGVFGEPVEGLLVRPIAPFSSSSFADRWGTTDADYENVDSAAATFLVSAVERGYPDTALYLLDLFCQRKRRELEAEQQREQLARYHMCAALNGAPAEEEEEPRQKGEKEEDDGNHCHHSHSDLHDWWCRRNVTDPALARATYPSPPILAYLPTTALAALNEEYAAATPHGITALQAAVRAGNYALAQRLVELVAVADSENRDEKSTKVSLRGSINFAAVSSLINPDGRSNARSTELLLLEAAAVASGRCAERTKTGKGKTSENDQLFLPIPILGQVWKSGGGGGGEGGENAYSSSAAAASPSSSTSLPPSSSSSSSYPKRLLVPTPKRYNGVDGWTALHFVCAASMSDIGRYWREPLALLGPKEEALLRAREAKLGEAGLRWSEAADTLLSSSPLPTPTATGNEGEGATSFLGTLLAPVEDVNTSNVDRNAKVGEMEALEEGFGNLSDPSSSCGDVLTLMGVKLGGGLSSSTSFTALPHRPIRHYTGLRRGRSTSVTDVTRSTSACGDATSTCRKHWDATNNLAGFISENSRERRRVAAAAATSVGTRGGSAVAAPFPSPSAHAHLHVRGTFSCADDERHPLLGWVRDPEDENEEDHRLIRSVIKNASTDGREGSSSSSSSSSSDYDEDSQNGSDALPFTELDPFAGAAGTAVTASLSATHHPNDPIAYLHDLSERNKNRHRRRRLFGPHNGLKEKARPTNLCAALVRLLTQHGACPNAVDAGGASPLDIFLSYFLSSDALIRRSFGFHVDNRPYDRGDGRGGLTAAIAMAQRRPTDEFARYLYTFHLNASACLEELLAAGASFDHHYHCVSQLRQRCHRRSSPQTSQLAAAAAASTDDCDKQTNDEKILKTVVLRVGIARRRRREQQRNRCSSDSNISPITVSATGQCTTDNNDNDDNNGDDEADEQPKSVFTQDEESTHACAVSCGQQPKKRDATLLSSINDDSFSFEYKTHLLEACLSSANNNNKNRRHPAEQRKEESPANNLFDDGAEDLINFYDSDDSSLCADPDFVLDKEEEEDFEGNASLRLRTVAEALSSSAVSAGHYCRDNNTNADNNNNATANSKLNSTTKILNDGSNSDKQTGLTGSLTPRTILGKQLRYIPTKARLLPRRLRTLRVFTIGKAWSFTEEPSPVLIVLSKYFHVSDLPWSLEPIDTDDDE